MKELWVEKYRPATVDGYVFRDEAQKKQIKQWINEQSIPHLLFSGAPGIGKCLAGDEEVCVEIDTSTLTSLQKEQLLKYKL
jgi:replication factor C small subunit